MPPRSLAKLRSVLLFASGALFTAGAALPLSAPLQNPDTRGVIVNTKDRNPSGTTYAILIGISEYQHVRSLAYADRDAKLFYDFLTSPLGGVDPDNIRIMTNKDATRANINAAVEEFELQAKPENSLILFVAGHGVYLKTEVDAKGRTVQRDPYILTNDSNPQDAKTTGYPMDDFRAMIARQAEKFGRVMVFVDVCHAANIAGIGGGSDLQTGVGDTFRGASGDIGLMVASTSNKYAFESPSFGGGHGAFSYFVVSGLNGSAVSAGRDTLRWSQLFHYVSGKVYDFTDEKQQPNAVASNDDLIIVRDIHRKGIELLPAEPLSHEDEQRESRNRQVFIEPVLTARGLDPVPASDKLSAGQFPAGSPQRAQAERRIRVALEDQGQQIVSRYLDGDQVPQKRDDFERCALLFDEAYRLTPSSVFDNSRALFCHGRALIFDGKYTEAEQLLRQSIQLDPARGYAWNAIGISKLEQINLRLTPQAADTLFDEAAQSFRTAMRYAPYWAYPLHNLALTLSERGDFDGAIRTYRAAMLVAPQYSYLPYNLGLLYTRTGDLSEAQRWFDAALKLAQNGTKSDTAMPLNALGALALRRGDLKAARKYLADAATQDPSNSNTRQNLALLAGAERNYPLADRLWSELTTASPDYIEARVSWAQSLSGRADTAGAIQQYNAILTIRPDWVGAHDALARLYLASGAKEKALAQVNAALDATPANPFLLDLRGDIYSSLSQKNNALTDWNSALKLLTDKAEARRIRTKIKALP